MPKPSSGRKLKVIAMPNPTLTGMPMAKTIAEANKLAVQYGLAQEADFKGIDIRAANEMLQQLKKTQDEFPGLLQLTFIGSHRELDKRENELITSIGGKMRKLKMDSDTLAMNSTRTINGHERKSIVLNSNLFSKKNYDSTLEKMRDQEELRLLCVGGGTFKGLIDHEIGHHIDNRFGIHQKNKTIQSLFNQHHVAKDWIDLPTGGWRWNNEKMTSALSAYANTNIKEFIAESWAEYRNNPNPRPVAKQVGNEVMKYISPRQPFAKRVGNTIMSFLKRKR